MEYDAGHRFVNPGNLRGAKNNLRVRMTVGNTNNNELK